MIEKDLVEKLSIKLNIESNYIINVLEMLASGDTIAFISRYRKNLTNNMDEFLIKEISEEYDYIKKLEKRKETIIDALNKSGLLTDDLHKAIMESTRLIDLENIYEPYKKGLNTRASSARKLGLEPLAQTILKNNKNIIILDEAQKYLNNEVLTVEKAIDGACDIIAEIVANDNVIRERLFNTIMQHARIVTKKNKIDKDIEKKYFNYYEFSKPIRFLEAYQLMAIERANDEKIISFKYEYLKDFLIDFAINKYTKKIESDSKKYIEKSVKDGFERLLIPSVNNSVHSELLQKAHNKSADIFSNNLQQLLLQKPIKNKIILGFDPGYLHGCKLAVVKENNELLETMIIYPHTKKNNIELENKKLINLIKKHNVSVIAIGDGTASNESVVYVSNLIKENNLDVQFCVVSESGASIYSASNIAAEEFPDLPVEKRSAISIARRLIDPLSELIKIEPKNIGVGQYQHDIDKKLLEDKLDFCISYCVNNVGVDINTASIHLLSKISGLNKRSAKSIIDYVTKNKKINSREEIKEIKFISDPVFKQAAGFLRVNGSSNFFDKTSIHPESYDLANKFLGLLKKDITEIIGNFEFLSKIDMEDMSKKLNTDIYSLEIIVDALKNPVRDFRDANEMPMLRDKIMYLNDLKQNDILEGVIKNITEFGLFVDIGIDKDGLVPKSKINSFEQFKLNQRIKVIVETIDIQTQRIGLRIDN